MLIPFKDIVRKYGKPRGILHVGANVGEEAAAYDAAGVKRVIWLEANPELHDRLLSNISKYEGHMISCGEAISDVDGEEVNFHVSNNGSQSSSLLEFGTHSIAHPEVVFTHVIKIKTMRIDSMFYESHFEHIDFLNVDVQGVELKVLRGMGEILRKFKYAYLEVNKEELYKDCALIGEIDAYMKGFSFKRVETKWCGNTGWGDALYIKR